MVNHIKNKKMNSLKPLHFKFTAILLLICCSSLFGQKIEPKERKMEPDHTITSTITGKEYLLEISFPKSYSTKDTISYPVLYAVDGKDLTVPSLRAAQKFMMNSKEYEQVIIVGISSAIDRSSWKIDRAQDYTPSIDTLAQKKIETFLKLPGGSLVIGEAAKFLDCIKTEIIPFIDKSYKTNSDRGIAGHSLGGLFTAYCLVNSDGYFTRFGISSPTLTWDNEKLLNQAVTKFNKNEAWELPSTKVFISVGGEDYPNYLYCFVKFYSTLQRRDYQNVHLQWQVFEKESHMSVIPASMSRILSVLYGKNE
jgi:predicted alpha/beta superfamily hydrolase